MHTATLSLPDRKAFLGGLTIAVIGAILFSAKAIVAKLMYRYQVDAVTVLAFRMMFSFPLFAAVAVWRTRIDAPLSAADLGRVTMLGLIGYLSSFLDFLGLQYISAGLERLILFLTPSFVLLISVVFYKKKITSVEWIALLTSYLGTVLVFLHDVRFGGDHVGLGSALVLCSAVSYALYLLFSGQLVKRVGAMRLVAYAMCISSVACVGQFFLLRPVSMLAQPQGVYALSLVNALFCNVLPVFMTMIAVARIGAPTASQAGMVGPVSTLFMGAVLLDEPVTGIQLVGTTLVLSGIWMLSKKKI
ncbi:MAG: DMT family transporter [Burkholderiaceae bacterium]